MPRSSYRPFLEPASGLRFLHIPMDDYAVDVGWAAFRFLDKELRRFDVRPEQLEWRYTEQNYAHIVAVFEVVPRV